MNKKREIGNRSHNLTELLASRLPFKWSMFSAVLISALLLGLNVPIPTKTESQVKQHHRSNMWKGVQIFYYNS